MGLYDLVRGQMELCQKYADDALENANDYLDALEQEVLEPFEPIDEIDYTWPEPCIDWDGVLRPDKPDNLVLTDRDEPKDAELVEIAVPDFPDIPAFAEDKPVVVYPDLPDTTMPEPFGDPPSLDDIEIPSSPSFTLPEPPTFDEIVLPVSPDIAFPEFTAEPPANDLVPPEVGFIYNEALYESDLKDALKARILSVVQNGGTGLGAEVESAIWNQAKLRAESEIARLYEEANSFWAARGWSIPPGALDARLYEVSVEQARALADINEKILIEQARLAQEMDKFIVQAGLQFEQQAMNYFNETQNRAFQAAKATVDAAIQIFQAKVLWYNAQMEAYKTAAVVYETKIKAELGKVEVFKAQIEAASLQIEVDKSEVQLYLAQLQGVTTLIELYKSQMQAASIHAEINKIKLDIFRTQVECYQIQVQAKVAEFDLYKAELSGEQLKVQVYSELVKAYTTRVQGLEAEISAKKLELEAQMAVNKEQIDIMLARTERYKALLASDTERIKTLASVYEIDGKLYSYDIQAAATELQSQIEIYRGRLSRARNETDVLLKEAEMNLQSFLQQRTMAIEAAKAGANVCAQLAASSMSAVHAGASIGYSGQESTQTSEHKSQATSTQTTYQHIYQES